MPKDELEDQVEVTEEEPIVDPNEEVVVEEETPAPPANYITKEDYEKQQHHWENQVAAGRRVTEKLNKQISDLTDRLPKPVEDTGDAEVDKLNKLVQKDWQEAVGYLVQKKLEATLAQNQVQAAEQQKQQASASVLEQCKSEVIQKYPDLNNENSDRAKKYMEIINKHPEYLQNVYGPRLAMRDMEDEMGKPAPRVNQSTGYIPTGRPTSQSKGRTVLTRQQLDFCKHHNINPTDYAKRVSSLETDGGVTL